MTPNGQLPLPKTPASYNQDTPPPLERAPPLSFTPFPANNGTASTSTSPLLQNHNGGQPLAAIPDDWSFLQSFGDPRDDFYALDVELRGLLDSELAGANRRFI